MRLSERRRIFSRNIALLILYGHGIGLECAIDDAKRPRTNNYSLHPDGLAVDLVMYKNGVYQRNPGPYQPLGDFWLSLHQDNEWGGRWAKRDANHFEMSKG